MAKTHPLLQRAQNEGTPLIDGETVTFVWQGRQAPLLFADFMDWEPDRAIRLERVGPGVWAHSTCLPRDAYIEYAFLHRKPPRRGRENEERAADPFNPRTTSNGFGALNHFFYMPDASPTTLTRRPKGLPRGAVTRHVIEAEDLLVGGRRAVYLYRPPAPGPCPLLVVLDGRDYHLRAKLAAQVDNLIARGRIRPIALAMVEHGGQARFIEYACSEATLGFVRDRLLPFAGERLNLLDAREHPGAHGILGASMGGLQALYTAARAPGVFGRVLSQSGAFSIWGHDFVVFDLIEHGPSAALKIWLGVGRYESLFAAHRRMHGVLAAKGFDVSCRESNAGHNYTAWRNDVARGLEHLFGA